MRNSRRVTDTIVKLSESDLFLLVGETISKRTSILGAGRGSTWANFTKWPQHSHGSQHG